VPETWDERWDDDGWKDEWRNDGWKNDGWWDDGWRDDGWRDDGWRDDVWRDEWEDESYGWRRGDGWRREIESWPQDGWEKAGMMGGTSPQAGKEPEGKKSGKEKGHHKTKMKRGCKGLLP
jgi:hypothetical protein